MRTIIDNLTVTEAQTATTSELQPGAGNYGWRLWDGILRVTSSTASTFSVELRSTITGEVIDTVNVVGGVGKSSDSAFKIPGVYDVRVFNVTVTNAVVSVYLDGDTGRSPDTVTVA